MTTPATGRQPAPSAQSQAGRALAPWEQNAELAAQKMMENMVASLGRPSIINKKFSVWHGILRGLTDSKIFDASVLVSVFDNVESSTVNINGIYFERFWAAIMKPKYVIQGMPYGQQEEEQPGAIARMIGWVRGDSSQNKEAQNANRN